VTGYFTFIAHKITSWMSCQQKIITLSLTEAEYMVLSNYGYQLVWMKNLLNKVSFNVPTPYIYSDNFGLLFWKSNLIQEKVPNILIFVITI